LIRNWQDPSYTKFRDELVARGKISILFIDHLIGSDDPQSTIYISIPFSTPSVIGQGNDIVSAYYDPTGRLFDPRRYKQVPMLSNFQELSSFVNA
jgi:polysaccharide biosynthesis PFTS motif protein